MLQLEKLGCSCSHVEEEWRRDLEHLGLFLEIRWRAWLFGWVGLLWAKEELIKLVQVSDRDAWWTPNRWFSGHVENLERESWVSYYHQSQVRCEAISCVVCCTGMYVQISLFTYLRFSIFLRKNLFFLTDQNFVFSICMTENGLKAVTICSLYDLFKLPTCALNQHVCMNWMCIYICVKQLCLFEPEQPHGGLQDAVTVKGEIAGGGMECKEMKRKEVFFFHWLLVLSFHCSPGT